MAKRHGLEEAKVSSLSEPWLPKPRIIQSELDHCKETFDSLKVADDRLLIQPSYAGAFDQQIISSFWEKYIPSNASAQSGSPCAWMQQVIGLSNPGEALYCSLKALAMTRLAWIHRDDALALKGHIFYSRALQVLKTALSQDYTIYQDEIFAAGYVLSIYEVR